MINIYDCNNQARVEFEVCPTGLPLRRLFEAAYYSGPSIYVFDGQGAKALRRADFPDYKKNRQAASDNFYILLNTYKELLEHTNNVIICVPGYEADDVIATYCKQHPSEEIVIHSTDRDFCALHRPGLTTPKANLKGIAVEDVRLFKTLVGDASDSIPGVKGFGKGAWDKLQKEQKEEWYTRMIEDTWQDDSYLMAFMGVPNKKCCEWLRDNWWLVRTYWKIIGFYDVPNHLLQKHLKLGVQNYPLADMKLKELLQ